MKNKDISLIVGGFLIVMGLVLLLQNFGFVMFGALLTLFWASAFAIGGAIFITVFIRDQNNWWALIPGFTLLGLAIMVGFDLIASDYASVLGAPIFMASIGLGFFAVYAAQRENWWAIIPGGVLMSIAAMIFLEEAFPGPEWVGVMFWGMAATFALLAILPVQQEKMHWAFIPAVVLFLIGAFFLLPSLGTTPFTILSILGPIAMVGFGLYILYRIVRPK